MFATALQKTLEKFNLSAKELALQAGVREAALSQFRNGKQAMLSDNLEKLIKALPDDAYHYYLAQLASDRISPQQMIQTLNVLSGKLESGEVCIKTESNSHLLVS